MARARILVGDDHAILREGLVRLLEPEFDVMGTAGDGQSLVNEAKRIQPDVVIFDIGMPLLNGIEAASHIRGLAPGAKLVFLTQHSGKEYLVAAFRAGASGYVLKNSAASELLEAVREVLAGRCFLSADLRHRFGDLQSAESGMRADFFGNALTSRQRQVLQLIAEGKSAKEIAYILEISPKTVEFHKSAIMDELGIRTTAELTRYAIEQGIVSPQ